MRQNKATVNEQGLNEAFAQGVNEGMRLVGYVTIFMNVGERVHKKQPTVAVAEVPAVVSEFLASLKPEHYEIGVSIRILSEGDITTEEQEQSELPDGVEDAEVVEDNQ